MSSQPVDFAQARSEMRTAGERRTATVVTRKPRLRFDLSELEVRWDEENGTLWSFMTPTGRPAFTFPMLRDLQAWQQEIQRAFPPESEQLRYLVLGSRFPGAFNLGGDLEFVADRAEARDLQALVGYGNTCIDILYQNVVSLNLPLVTIALIQGDAIGGGFEVALSFDVIVAERGTRFSFPDHIFGMFPGVGAHVFLTRKLNAAQAEKLMLSGRTYTAEEMYELGLVHVLAEPGEGEQAVADYIANNLKRQTGQYGVYRAAREINPITVDELRRIVNIWAETAIRLQPHNIKMMRRLAAVQERSSQRHRISA
jgi:Enoyl-CoA hydratase/carnithine racemase